MSEGPSKLLYVAGGWFLGGLAGTFAGAAVGAAAIALTAPIATALLIGEIVAMGGSVIGCLVAWNKADHAQEEYEQLSTRAAMATKTMEPERAIAPTVGSSFTDRVKPKMQEASYAESITNERLNATATQASR